MRVETCGQGCVLTVFEYPDHQRVVTLRVPPRSRRALLWSRELEAEGLGRHPLHDLLLVVHEHLPANDVELANAEDDPVVHHNTHKHYKYVHIKKKKAELC